jgi:hypothetical protein
MGLNNWLGVEDNWKGLLAPNGKLQFVESASGAVQDVTYNGWLMQPQLQGQRLNLPDKSRAKAVPWAAAGPNALNQPLTWLQAEFPTPPGSSALVLDVGGLGRGHAYVNGFDIGRYWTILGTPCSECKCGGDMCCNRALCDKPSQQLYHIPPDVLKLVGGAELNLLVVIEELGAIDLTTVHVRRFNESQR